MGRHTKEQKTLITKRGHSSKKNDIFRGDIYATENCLMEGQITGHSRSFK
jgi:hypothetical protein